MRRSIHWLLVAVTVAVAAPGAGGAALAADTSDDGCVERVLVLGAMPLEIHPFLEAGSFDPADTVRAEERDFHVGELAGHDVVLAMTGIGLVNARETAATAFEHVGCGFYGVVFSGVAGSKRSIGDVSIPQRWTLDDGRSWTGVDPIMFDVAGTLAGPDEVPLRRDVPIGDDACLCAGVETIGTPVELEHQPQVFVGGDGVSYDTYGDRSLPCVPGGGDVFGCEPCLVSEGTVADTGEFARDAPSYADPEFLRDFFQPPAETTDTYEAQDMETAAVAQVAAGADVPFLGIRSASDGRGDPLGLPGFPFQFFAYRHLAGENAAATTIAFLERWPPDDPPAPESRGATSGGTTGAPRHAARVTPTTGAPLGAAPGLVVLLAAAAGNRALRRRHRTPRGPVATRNRFRSWVRGSVR